MVAWGCAVWGIGLVLSAVLRLRRRLSVLLPALPDLRLRRWYNPWTGAYGRGAVAYGPYGGAGVGARYNPWTGTYARGAAAYGPYGARGVAQAYNPRTGAYARDAAGIERLRQLGIDRRAARRRLGQDQPLHQQPDRQHDAHGSQRAKAMASCATGDDGGGRSRRGGDVYAGHDGNVYRKERAAAGRSTTTAGGTTRRTSQPASVPRRIATPIERGRHDRSHRRSIDGRSIYDRSIEPGFRRAQRGQAAHQRLQQLQKRKRWQPQHGQLSRWRRRSRGRRRRPQTVRRLMPTLNMPSLNEIIFSSTRSRARSRRRYWRSVPTIWTAHSIERCG